MAFTLTTEILNNISKIIINNPPVNSLSHSESLELLNAIKITKK